MQGPADLVAKGFPLTVTAGILVVWRENVDPESLPAIWFRTGP
jgi:hypothetical protein